MKRVRLFAMLLASALFVSTIPVTGASAAQKVSEHGNCYCQRRSSGSCSRLLYSLGWVKKGNNWYYVTKKGYHTGWAKINNLFYYFNKDGVMQTGFIKDHGKWYFCTYCRLYEGRLAEDQRHMVLF